MRRAIDVKPIEVRRPLVNVEHDPSCHRRTLIGLALALAYAPIVGFVVRSILCLLSLI